MSSMRSVIEKARGAVEPSSDGYERVKCRGGRRQLVVTLISLVALVGAGVAIAASVIPASNSSAAQIFVQLPGQPIDAERGYGDVWTLTCDSGCAGTGRRSQGHLVAVDARSARIVHVIRVVHPQASAVGDGSLWSVDFWDSSLTRRDRRSGRVLSYIRLSLSEPVGAGDNRFLPMGVTVGEGGVWVTTDRGYVARVSAATDRVVDMIAIGPDDAGPITAGAGAVWMGTNSGVLRIDPRTNGTKLVRIRGTGGRLLQVNDVATTKGSVWATGAWSMPTVDAVGHRDYVQTTEAALARIQRRPPYRIRILRLRGRAPAKLVAENGSVWLAHLADHQPSSSGKHENRSDNSPKYERTSRGCGWRRTLGRPDGSADSAH